ncbi:uncharacterized protein LOC118743841 [Rhagoletis pomonella]|uniref:uncharacterized protein LOC118743841 n=1 Tax=Rhagoletis pomonella TaxID=28610 RepID=UPI00177B0CEB|nr:uncharacterized protein LOC118743841 [Rhagoletis pomonella]
MKFLSFVLLAAFFVFAHCYPAGNEEVRVIPVQVDAVEANDLHVRQKRHGFGHRGFGGYGGGYGGFPGGYGGFPGGYGGYPGGYGGFYPGGGYGGFPGGFGGGYSGTSSQSSFQSFGGGNESADEMARCGSKMPTEEADSSVLPPFSDHVRKINEYTVAVTNDLWNKREDFEYFCNSKQQSYFCARKQADLKMKSTVIFCLALCLLVVMCHGVPVQRETLLSIEQPAAVVFEYQPQQLRRVARQGYPYEGFGGYGVSPGGEYGGYRRGGIGSASSQSIATASASSQSNGGYYPSPYYVL